MANSIIDNLNDYHQNQQHIKNRIQELYDEWFEYDQHFESSVLDEIYQLQKCIKNGNSKITMPDRKPEKPEG